MIDLDKAMVPKVAAVLKRAQREIMRLTERKVDFVVVSTYEGLTIIEKSLPEQIKVSVCSAYQVKITDLNQPNRGEDHIVEARFMAYKLMKDFMPMISLKRMGQLMGGRDHATVINGLQKINYKIETDKSVAVRYELLKNNFKPILK